MRAISAKASAPSKGMKLGISERDIKLLLVVLIAAIIGLPYYFLINPGITQLQDTQAEISKLQAEKLRLEEYVKMIPTYNAAIEEYVADIAGILTHYPRELPQEASIIFIARTEEEAAVKLQTVSFSPEKSEQITAGAAPAAEVAPATEYADPMLADYEQVGQRVKAESSITLGGTEEEEDAVPGYTRIGDILSGVVMDMNFSYSLGYQEYKDFLDYVLNNQERHVITRLAASYDEDERIVSGTFTMSAYAIYGFNRYPVSVATPQFELGTGNIFLEAMGLHAHLEDFTADLFIQLRNAGGDIDAAMIGLSRDPSSTSYLTSDENDKQEIILNLVGSNGRYIALYSLNGVEYEGEPIILHKTENINLDVYSAIRMGIDDNVTATISVINQTNLRVNVTIYDEDSHNPRVTLETEGDVRVTNL